MTLRRIALIGIVLASLTSCTGDAEPSATSRSSTTAVTDSTTTVASDPALEPLLVTADDLPAGFTPHADVDDTVTAFCAGQDATAGLRASGRAIAGFQRTPVGASVIEVVFRFDGDGASQFVMQADDLLTGCSDVPDATGLAFTYEPISPNVATALAGVQTVASRYGVSFGSGNLTVNVAVIQQDDIGVLVAVLGLDLPREELDALTATAFTAARTKLQAA